MNRGIADHKCCRVSAFAERDATLPGDGPGIAAQPAAFRKS